jgi:hypothetical protein
MTAPRIPSAAAVIAAAGVTPHPTAANPPMGLDDTARHLLALADEPDALDRIRAVLLSLTDRAQEAEAEEWREKIRDRAQSIAGTAAEELDRARQATIRNDPHSAAACAVRAASLIDRAAGFRALL